MKLQLQHFTATSEIQDKFHCHYWDFCMDNKTGMVLNVETNVVKGAFNVAWYLSKILLGGHYYHYIKVSYELLL